MKRNSVERRNLSQMPKLNPYVALAIGVASVSFSAILVKLATAPSGVIAFYRLLFTVLLMLPVFLVKYRHELKFIKKRIGCIRLRQECFWLSILFYGLNRLITHRSRVQLCLSPSSLYSLLPEPTCFLKKGFQ